MVDFVRAARANRGAHNATPMLTCLLLLADIIAVAGNPLDNVRVLEEVSFVMKGGQIYYGAGSTPRR